MKIQRVYGLEKLSDADYINWKRKALQDGYITDGTSFNQIDRIYLMQQLSNAGLNPNLSLDQANAILASGLLKDLIKNNQLGEEILPLIQLYLHNPELAGELTQELFDSGYMTLDERNLRALTSLNEKYGKKSAYEGGQGWNTFYKGVHDVLGEVPLVGGVNESILGGVAPLDKDIKSLNEYDSTAFKYYYDKVADERSKVRVKLGTEEEEEESIYQEARRRYLIALNTNIWNGIQSKIDSYYAQLVDAIAPQIEKDMASLTPKEIVTQLYGEAAAQQLGQLDSKGRLIDAFDIFAGGAEETQQSAYGDIVINHPGSNYWRAYKDTSVFDNFNDNDKKQIMAKYLAYREYLGEGKANEWLETTMLTYVAQNRGWGKAIADVTGGIGTTAGLIIPEALVGVGGLAYDVLGAVLPEDHGGQWARNQASMMLTGRDLQGREVGVPTWDESSDPFSWLGSRLNLGYLNKVSLYKNWDIDEIRRAEANGGVSKDAMYVVDPTKGHQFKNDALDMLDMTGQAIGQIALAYLTSGASLEEGAAANLSRMAATARVGAEVATVAAPIASAYAVTAANEAYNTTLQAEAEAIFNQLSRTPEYQKQKKEAIDAYFNQGSRKGLDGTIYFAPFDSEEARRQQEELYDSQQREQIYKELKDNGSQLAQNSSLLAYRTSASIEALKYGYTTAMFGSWKLSGNANKLLELNLGVKTYGNLTQNTAGKFAREGIHPLGIKKLTLTNPNQIAWYKTAESAIVGGGISNFTDDVTTGFAVGLSLGYSNSALLREYDPQAYADTWYGDSEAAQALYILGSGIQGANDMIKSGQPWHSFYIGVGGSFLGAGFRFRGKDLMRQQYADENARYKAETGKDIGRWTKFKLGVNTYTLTIWSTYEDARLGVNRLDYNIKQYNETLDKRQDALNEIASMRQGLILRKYADNEMSFSDATLESDNLALKLIAIQHSLSSNPLRKMDKLRFDTELTELNDIAEDNVSDEKREALIQSAFGAREQDKSKPLTDLRKAEIWEDIKANARRFSDFSSDYYEAIDYLKHSDRSFGEPGNWPLLHQKAELIAKSKRIQRDIDTLSKEVGITVDTSVTDRTQGELTETARKSSIKAALETIETLNKLRQEAQDRLDVLQEKSSTQELTEAERDELLSQQALIMRADRVIPRLQAEIDSLEEGTTLAQADTGLTTNVILLHNMLSSPELYTTKQQDLINKYKALIGEKGVLYVEEMAKMQDQMNEMQDAQEALEALPDTFQALITGLQNIREAMGLKAIYNTRLLNSFNFLKTLPQEKIGSNAAISLTSPQFDLFIEENPELTNVLAPYKSVNEAFSLIYSLTQTAREAQTMDEATLTGILRDIQSLVLDDVDYFVENGRQGVADMMEFLIAAESNPTKIDALKSLLTDFKRVASIDQSTVAYTEHRIRKMAEQFGELADQLVEKLKRNKQEQIEVPAETQDESVPDFESMDNNTGESIDLEDETIQETPLTEVQEERQTQETEESQKEPKSQEEAQQEQAEDTQELPAGVTRNSDGQVETMTAEEQAEQLGITKVVKDSMVDDSTPKVQEVTSQLEEVHGCYFNMYEGQALNAGELVPFTEGPIYEWLSNEGINLGNIIDNELSNILKVNPKIQLMKVKKEGSDSNVASNIFLVVEYTDKVAKQHLPENGGVITSNGKRYLIVGTMWNTKSQDGTEVASIMQTTRNNLLRNGVQYFDSNPSERFYVDPVMNTLVTTFYSGHIVHTVDGEAQPHTIAELLDEHNRTHTSANLMSLSDLGFGVITMNEGFYPVGPHSAEKIHAPLRQTIDKYGQVYVLVPAANGEIVPIFINPTLLSEIRESALKTRIDTVLIPQLLSEDFYVRELAISELCQLLCISGSITNPEGKGILIGKVDIPTVSLVNGKSVIGTFDIKKGGFTVEDFRQSLYQLNPRINLSLSNLAQPGWVQRYDEAGAITTDATKLGTYGSKYYVAPIDPATGQPIRVENKPKPVEPSSDYSKAQPRVSMLHVMGNRYVFRDGRWKREDNTLITDPAEKIQVAWAYRVQTGEAQLALRVGSNNYYVMGVETSSPQVIGYNIATESFEGVSPEIANQIISEKRASIERAKAEAAAKELLEQQLEVSAAETIEESPTTEVEAEPEAPVEEAPEVKLERNDFELKQIGEQDRYSVDDILDSTDEAMMEYSLRIFEAIEENIATSEKWKDFNMENIISELERLGIETNIDDIESWIDNLKNCEK